LKKDKQTIKCSVEHCKYNEERCCNLDKIQVAPCEAGDVEKESKEATMCDSYKTE
jgi:hypothetical protein